MFVCCVKNRRRRNTKGFWPLNEKDEKKMN